MTIKKHMLVTSIGLHSAVELQFLEGGGLSSVTKVL